MNSTSGWIKASVLLGSALTVAACSTYPREPRYPVRPTDIISGSGTVTAPPVGAPPAGSVQNPYYNGQAATPPAVRPPEVEQGVRAPAGQVEGGSLAPPVAQQPYVPPAAQPVVPTPAPAPVTPPSGPIIPGASYQIQPGDTISGVGRRFQTPVQTLIDLNNLGPRAAINVGQKILLPDSAVDRGSDPYATGPSPVGVRTSNDGVVPPPPPPPSGNAPLPQAPRPAPAPAPSTPTTRPQTPPASGAALAMQWPVRGEIVRRFGPAGMGERNNGINIAAAAGASVKAAADGRVAYVGDDIVGQGLTVLIVHKDGWRTVYGHLGSSTVRDGADVRAGQTIGTVGLTAGDGRPSMHFETRQMRGDDPVAVDPVSVLPR